MNAISIRAHSGIYTLKAVKSINMSIDEAWDFLSNPHNLPKITPDHMNFAITSETGDKIYEGQIITYKVSPMPMMRMSWVTEITKIEEGRMFIDEQRFGPYRMWHHEHQLEANGKETLMTDIVSYKVPFGPLGKLMHGLMIQRQLEGIFSHRSKVMDKLFPASQPTQFTSPKPESEMISA